MSEIEPQKAADIPVEPADPPFKPVRTDLAPPLDPEAAMRFVERIALGQSMQEIAAELPYPSPGLFLLWVSRHTDLAIAYKNAREMSAFMLEDEALALSRKKQRSPGSMGDLRAAEALVGQLRWSAAKRNPGAFSDKASVSLVVPVHISTPLDLGTLDSSGGGSTIPDIYQLEAHVSREVPKRELTDDQILAVLGDANPAAPGEGQGADGPKGPRQARAKGPEGPQQEAGAGSAEGSLPEAREGHSADNQPAALDKEAKKTRRPRSRAKKEIPHQIHPVLLPDGGAKETGEVACGRVSPSPDGKGP